MEKYNKIWHKIKYKLELELSDAVFQELFSSVNEVYKEKNNYIYLIVPNPLVKKRIELLHLKKLNSYLPQYFNEEYRFKMITLEDVEKEKNERKLFSETGIKEQKLQKHEFSNINPSYTFDSFVVGNSNRLAYTAAMKVADQPGIVANPLYIFGNVGLGKTHLMQCVGNYVLEGDIKSKVLYVKTDQFVEEYVRLASQKNFEKFNNKYRDVDVLLVDDIQFLAKKEKSQIEFFKLFEILHNQQKQIVITSDRPASELKDIMSRLTSRFEWGVIVDINRPDHNHRIQILKKKLAVELTSPKQMPDEILEYIASFFTNNIRELEGALKRILFYCTAFNYEFTLENAMQALDNLVKTQSSSSNFVSKSNINDVLSIVAEYYNITTHDILSRNRKRIYVFPRQVSMYILKKSYKLTNKKIGDIFGGRDHSTVIHSIEKITNDIEMDKFVKNDVDKLLVKCGKK